jgi:hypothetical protein
MCDERQAFVTNGSENRLHKLVESSGVLPRYGYPGICAGKFQLISQRISFFRTDFFQIDNKGAVRPHEIRNAGELLFDVADGVADALLLNPVVGFQKEDHIIAVGKGIYKLIRVKTQLLLFEGRIYLNKFLIGLCLRWVEKRFGHRRSEQITKIGGGKNPERDNADQKSIEARIEKSRPIPSWCRRLYGKCDEIGANAQRDQRQHNGHNLFQKRPLFLFGETGNFAQEFCAQNNGNCGGDAVDKNGKGVAYQRSVVLLYRFVYECKRKTKRHKYARPYIRLPENIILRITLCEP